MSEPERNVIGLHGQRITDTREPNPDLIKAIEELLERVRSGEVQAVGYCEFYYDRTAGFAAYGADLGYSLLGASVMLTNYLAEAKR